MSEKVSAFWPVRIGRFEYLFFLVNWSDYSTSITDSLEKNLEIFGADLALRGKVIKAYRGRSWNTFEEVKKKENWPYDVRARFDIEQDPFMLIINEDFGIFDPKEHKWSIIWFSDFRENPDSIPRIFCSLVQKIRQNENLFDYFQSLATKKAAKAFIGYFEVKPGIFGISIDVKAILEDLAEWIQTRRG